MNLLALNIVRLSRGDDREWDGLFQLYIFGLYFLVFVGVAIRYLIDLNLMIVNLLQDLKQQRNVNGCCSFRNYRVLFVSFE